MNEKHQPAASPVPAHDSTFEDISAQMPLDRATHAMLVGDYGFETEEVNSRQEAHGRLIRKQLGNIGLALDATAPGADHRSIHRYAGLHDTVEKRAATETANDGEQYNFKDGPERKLELDSRIVMDYMKALGPTNPRRTKEGADIGYELAHSKRLLEKDYENIPEDERKPAMRYTEGVAAEELALLWRPDTLPRTRKAGLKNAEMFANPEDPNLFTEEQIKTIPEEERWQMVGAKLCDEAAEIFEGIFEGRTKTGMTELSAHTRMTDMKIRAAQIRLGIAGGDEAAELKNRIYDLAKNNYSVMAVAFRHENIAAGAARGKLYELLDVAKVRGMLAKSGKLNDVFLRLSTPREDEVHRKVPGYKKGNQKINLSTDSVIENKDGNFVIGYQVKSMSRDNYELESRRKQAEKGEIVIYPERRTRMRFQKSDGEMVTQRR